ncbi:gamma-glutamyl-gamma-aminobutyrate hydrolase family protein [Dendrosporobacter sp. 1207_IL3150]|uniref:gamma-glutamyl-gamma-aminobutyrate hydrolase family protein n=1 Tax=Dendrosporobacter sp. 1207_IL3150 TaxID=3084054 RepID=UPI002FDACB4E
MRPVIGITANTIISENTCFPGSERSCVNVEYIEAVVAAGGTPVVLPVVSNPDVISVQAQILDGLLVTGGYDVHPLLYGEEPFDKLEFIDPDRDNHEIELVKITHALKKPIFGICRGIQLINVAFGGTLYQDLSQSPGSYIKHMQKSRREVAGHSIEVVKGSKLYEVFGEFVITNSFHHQSVKDVADGFIVSALSKDGIIEGIEKKGDCYLVAVQWHPEDMIYRYPVMLGLFQRFIEEAAKPRKYKNFGFPR